MDNKFDELAKGLAQSVTRRQALNRFGVGLAGMALACFGLVINFEANGQTYETIDYPGAVLTLAVGINDSGQIVGRYIDAGGINHGFLFSSGTFTDVTFPGAVWTRAIDINRSGDIVGDYSLTDPGGVKNVHGYLLHRGVFVSFDFPGAYATVAQGINRNGDVVGLYTDNPGSNSNNGNGNGTQAHHGFLLSGGVFTAIDFPGAAGTEAWKINDNGQIVGRYLGTTDTKFHIYRLINGVFSSVPDVPGAAQTAPATYSHVGGLNSNGDIASDYSSSTPVPNIFNAQVQQGLHGFFLSGGIYTSVDFPGALATICFGINDGQAVVGFYTNPDGTFHGYLRTP